MGTRSLLTFCNDKQTENGETKGGEPFITIYRQYDGYPEGRGKELAEWLLTKTVVNGITVRSDSYANGIECLAAQWIAYEKRGDYLTESQREGFSEIGNVYLHPLTYDLEFDSDSWCEWLYRVEVTKNKKYRIWVRHMGDEKYAFVGGPKRFLGWVGEVSS